MSKIFKIIPRPGTKKDSPTLYSLGIQIKIGSREDIFPVTDELSQDDLEMEIRAIGDEINELLEKARTVSVQNTFNIDDSDAPEEIWAILSAISDDEKFRDCFNGLDEDKRKELAAYILENCNMFTGRGAYFSARYEQETGLIE